MALIGHVYGNIDQFYFINDTTKAITINVEKIGEFVLDLLLKNPGWDNENGPSPDHHALIPEVLGAGALRISVAEGAFGFANVVAADHIAMKDLVCDLRNDASFGEKRQCLYGEHQLHQRRPHGRFQGQSDGRCI